MPIGGRGSGPASRLTRRVAVGGILAAPLVAGGGPAFGGETLSIRFDYLPWGLHSALHLAKAKGWFEADGLAVDLQDGIGTLHTINLVAAGNVDVGLVQLGPMAIARAQGLPVTSFVGLLRKGDLAVLVDAKTGPKTTEELAGKKIVCFANSPWAPFIDNYLKRIGLVRGEGADKVNVIMVSPAAMVPVYATGGADGFMSLKEFGEPYVEKARPAHSFLAADSGIVFPSFGLIATEATLTRRKDTLAKLAARHGQAWEYIFADPAHVGEAVQAVISARPNQHPDPAIIRGQTVLCKEFFDTPYTSGKPLGWQSAEDWKQALALMSETGVLKSAVSISDCYTNDLIKS
jgi:NitT/TauT family transport system substrate-binding protein